MSSGNPFRASQQFKPPAFSPVPRPSSVYTDSSLPEAPRGNSDQVLEQPVSPPPQKTKKQVRIVSPTTSRPPQPEDDDDSYQRSRHRLAPEQPYRDQPGGSSLPPTASARYTDRYPTPSWEDTHRMSESNTQLTALPPNVTPQKTTMAVTPDPPFAIPANPFSRTLATLEPYETASADGRMGTETSVVGSSQITLDVESFKNLLLTGRPTPPLPAPSSPMTTAVPHTVRGLQSESAISAESSSLPHPSSPLRSLHEANQEAHTPSYAMPGSDEDESIASVSDVRKGKKKPPPTPRHRHGKLVTPRQPQVVSFDDFSATAPAIAPTFPRDSSDVTKARPSTPTAGPPLPPPPPPPTSSQRSTRTNAQSLPEPPSLAESSPPAPDLVPLPKKIPPPVPLARRQSQLRAASTPSNRSRSSSTLTIASQHLTDPPSSPPATSLHDPALSASKSPPPSLLPPPLPPPPPPPPSRHGTRISAKSAATETPSRACQPTTPLDSDWDPWSPSSSAMPRVVPSLSSSSTRHDRRTASGESMGDFSFSSPPSLPQPPPPPPPPPPPSRRRHPHRSSLDAAHVDPVDPCSPTGSYRSGTENEMPPTSVEHQDGKRRASVAREHAVSGSILEDMDEFQREIDELRTRYE